MIEAFGIKVPRIDRETLLVRSARIDTVKETREKEGTALGALFRNKQVYPIPDLVRGLRSRFADSIWLATVRI